MKEASPQSLSDTANEVLSSSPPFVPPPSTLTESAMQEKWRFLELISGEALRHISLPLQRNLAAMSSSGLR